MNHYSQIYLPKLTKINKIIIAIACIIFIADFFLIRFASITLQSYLGLSAKHFFDGEIYLVVTYPFISQSLMEVILNCLMLWLMGSEFEANWGERRYLGFLSSVVFGGGILYLGVTFLFFKNSAIFAYPLIGLSGIVSSLCVAYAVIYPDRLFSFMMILPIQAKYFCFILVAISLFQGLSGPLGVGAWGQLGGILAAYLFMVAISNRNVKKLSQKFGQLTQVRSIRKSKAKLTIVKDDNDTPPKYWH